MSTQARTGKNASLLFLTGSLAFILSAGMRLVELSRWNPGEDRVGGEFILATNDAYAWVAGAEDPRRREAQSPMAAVLRLGARFLSSTPANMAFWMPAILGGLVAVPIVVWAFHLGYAHAALPGALLASLAPAFFSRSRLGFYDTDWAILFFPLLTGWMLARWLASLPPAAEADPATGPPGRLDRAIPYVLPVVIAISTPWHASIAVLIASMLWITLFLGLILRRAATDMRSIVPLIAFSLPLAAGWPGALLGVGTLWLVRRAGGRLGSRGLTRIALLVLVGLLFGVAAIQLRDYLLPTGSAYLGAPVPQSPSLSTGPTLAFPNSTVSVGETQRPDARAFLGGIGFSPLLGFVGLAGFVYLVWRHSRALILIPLLGVGLASLRLGARFAMLAVPAVGLGWLPTLEGSLSRILRRLHWQGERAHLAVWLATCAAVAVAGGALVRPPFDPVVSEGHADALRRLRDIAQPEAVVWTWWDFGYAAEHFSGVESYADGGRNSGERLFTLGWVMGSPSPALSAQMMRFAELQGGTPWRTWSTSTPQAMDAWLDDLEGLAMPGIPPRQQYLVVAWDAISLLPWIQYYGSWDFPTATGTRSEVSRQMHPLSFDLGTGLLAVGGGQQVTVLSADLLASDVQHFEFPENGPGRRALVSLATGEVMVLDERAYRSTLVQLLIGTPDWIEAQTPFHLVIDRLPEARVFRVDAGDAR